MIYHISHQTVYAYAKTVSISHNLAHLTARNCDRQTLLRHELDINVPASVSETWTDYFGNPVTSFTIQEPHEELSITAINQVRVHPPTAPDPSRTIPWEQAREHLQAHRDPEALDAYQFTFDSPYIKRDPTLAEYAAPSFPPGRPILEAVLDLTHRIHKDFRFDPAATTTATPLSQVFELRRGVCQDFAHIQIGCLRSLDLAARYVSGYLLTKPPPGQPRLIGADASHAWLSVYCGEDGWIDVDPTNDVIPSEKHILLAWGRDYDDISPVKGVIVGGARHSVKVAVDVMPVH